MARSLAQKKKGTTTGSSAGAAPLEHVPAQTLLTAHTIEPELLQGYPRYIRYQNASKPYLSPIGVIALFCVALAIPVLSKSASFPQGCLSNPDSGSWVAAVVALSFSIYFFLVSMKALRVCAVHRLFLRSGIASPAIVYDIRSKDGDYRVKYIYPDSLGEMQTGALLLTWEELDKRTLEIGSTFTVLVQPEDTQAALPYFQIKDVAVIPIEPTIISRRVSADIATQATLVPQPWFGSMGIIEPELRTATPRPVRVASQFWRVWRHIFWLSVCATVSYPFVYKPVFTVILLITLCIILWQPFHRAHLLRRGVAVRARIQNLRPASDTCSDPEEAVVTSAFEYETTDGKIFSSVIYLKQRQAWELGIAEGTTFTVLYLPNSPWSATPYFTIHDVDVAGKTGAIITPSLGAKP